MRPMKVLANANKVIDLLSKEGAMTPGEIAERVDIPRPSVYRLLEGLHAVGLTDPHPDSTARLSLRWLHLADHARGAMSEWSDAEQTLQRLVDRTGQTAYLSVLRNNEAVCTEWVQGRAIGVLLLKPGRSLPLHAGAAGRALLAFNGNVEDYLAGAPPRRYTSKTLTDREALEADVKATRERGYSISDGDVTEGISALGAPVTNPARTVLGAISLAGLTVEMRPNREELARELLVATAELGSSAPRM